MYKYQDIVQYSIYDFILPFGGHLNPDNRWVRLAQEIDWKIIDDEYSAFFSADVGNEAYSSRVAFGSLYIQRKLGVTDRELVMQITENPYLQYFIGNTEYIDTPPFDPSTLVYFRKRLTKEIMDRIIEKMFIKEADNNDKPSSGDDNNTDSSGGESTAETENNGTLVIDATCAPADIAYPTDLELCDKARVWTEKIVDVLYKEYGPLYRNIKPRTYRKEARNRFLALNKRRKKPQSKIRQELRYQLNCIERNIGYIDDYAMRFDDAFKVLLPVMKARLETIRIFLEQQRTMLETGIHRIDNRIVSRSQPWVRPIVRGKSKAPTEFGMKLSISVVNGYVFVDKRSFDAYNEGAEEEFIQVVELYVKRFGHYPERILADKIYRTRKNRKYCKDHGIRIQGLRHSKDPEKQKKEYKETGERNIVEGKFGNGKRALGLGRIMAKLEETTENMITMDMFILNMETYLRRKFSCAPKANRRIFAQILYTIKDVISIYKSTWECSFASLA